MKTIPEGVCCVCHHPLKNHFNEKHITGEVFRCHSLAADFYQCECRLQPISDPKLISELKLRVGLRQFDLRLRREEYLSKEPSVRKLLEKET